MKPLPRVVCSIDGSSLPVQDYSFTSVANGGYHEFRGQAPVRKLLALGADQEAPFTVYHEETGDILWDGRFVTDPEIIEGVGLISATGPKAELEKSHGRLNYQTRDYQVLTDIQNPPHNVTSTAPHKLHMQINDGGILIGQEPGETIGVGEYVACALWTPGMPIVRVAYEWLSSFADADWKIEVLSSEGPSAGGLTSRSSTGMGATSQTVDTSWIAPSNHDMVQIQQVWRGGAPAGMGGHYTLIKNLRINGQSSADFFADDVGYASEVLTDVGRRVGFNTSLVEPSGLNVLPLDWRGSRASLVDYIVSLLDWRWLVSTIPSPGTGLIQYLEAGPWEREWTLFKGSRARPNLKPQQRRNEAIVTYQDVGGADREVRVRADPDPLAKWGVVRTIEETLADVQPGSSLATAVATTYAQRYSQKIWVGDIDAADARDDSGRGDARLVKPGDIGRLADWGPSEETFHRIHGTEQTQTTVRYSIESPISAVSLIEGAALEWARRPSEAQLPELEELLAEAAGEPAPYANRYEWYAQWASPDRGMPDKRQPGGKKGIKKPGVGALGKKGRRYF